MLIRKIEKKDDARVAFIIRECLTEYGCAGMMDTAWGDPYLDHFSEVYVNDNNCYWVAENDEGIVVAGVGIGPLDVKEACGCSETSDRISCSCGENHAEESYEVDESRMCELQKMYCLPEYRGSGIAQKLLDEALSFAKERYSSCYLETRNNMDRAKRFYEKNGFNYTEKTFGNTGHCGCNYHYILIF